MKRFDTFPPLSLRLKLVLSYLIVALGAILILAIAVSLAIQNYFANSQTDQLRSECCTTRYISPSFYAASVPVECQPGYFDCWRGSSAGSDHIQPVLSKALHTSTRIVNNRRRPDEAGRL